MGEVADVVQRIQHDLCMTLKVVGCDKDFIIAPDIVRGWMAPDAHFGDKQHKLLSCCPAVLWRTQKPRQLLGD